MELIIDPIFLVLFLAVLCALPIGIAIFLYFAKSKNKPITSADPSDLPAANPAKQISRFGCLILSLSLVCLLTLPINFVFTLGVGMSGDLDPLATQLIIVAFLIHIIAAILLSIFALSTWGGLVFRKLAGANEKKKN